MVLVGFCFGYDAVFAVKVSGMRKKKLKRKIREGGYGYAVVSIPPKIIRELGIKLNQEVIVEKSGRNPFDWEIKLKPVT